MTLTVRSASVTGAVTAGRALTHAEMDANWAHVIQSANQTFLPSGIGAVATDLQTRGRQIVYLTDFAANGVSGAKVDPTGVLDSSAGIIAAINSIDTSGGKGGTVIAPAAGVFNIGTTTINGKTNVRLQFAGRRSTLINYSGTGSAFVFDGITESGLIGARINPGTSATAVALDIKTTSASVLENLFDDLEISSSNVAGQIGVRAVQSGGSIISENIFSRIYIFGLDKPIVRTGCEGNEWYGIVLSTFGTGASPVAMNGSGNHNDLMLMRVAGVGGGVTTPIAVQETGDQNRYFISADIGATGKTLNTSGMFNRYYLRRAVRTTPVGTYNSVSESVDDGDYLGARRAVAGGTALAATDFALSAGWGASATVTAVTGTDQAFGFTINAAGAGQAANPTVSLTFKDGAWPVTPKGVAITRVAGNQPTMNLGPNSIATTSLGMICLGTPVAGESYLFSVIVMG